MSDVWNAITGGFEAILVTIHDFIEPVFGAHAWGWAIVILTLAVRVLLLPLAIKQTRSMRAMQELQPKIKQLQKKYKTDRELMRKDPELYRKRKQKLNEETMALYKEEGVNPVSGCLPLLAQMPIFLALFSVLRGSAELVGASFHFFTSFGNTEAYATSIRERVFVAGDDGTLTSTLTGYGQDVATHFGVAADQVGDALNGVNAGLDMNVSIAGWPGWLLIVLMGVTMFVTQRQLMARNTTADPQQQQTQKIMMYVMPVFLAVISFNLPLGVLVYWVTTNLWQVVQQQIVLREAAHAAPAGKGTPARPTRGDKSRKISDASTTPDGNGAAGSRKSATKRPPAADSTDSRKTGRDGQTAPQPKPKPKPKPKKDHLPRRPGN